MWCWVVGAALASEPAAVVNVARAYRARGWSEAAVAVLDPHLAGHPQAAPLRFELAAELDDEPALQAVLTE